MSSSSHYLRNLVLAAIVVAALAALAQKAPTPPAKSALDKTTFEAYVRHLFVWGPQVQVKIGDPKPCELPGFSEITVYASSGTAQAQQRFFVSGDGQKVVQGAVYDIKRDPFGAQNEKIKTDGPRLGEADAPIVLVEYSDFQCPFCKDEAKMLRENLISAYPKLARLYFKDFPLDQLHPWARMAAIAGRCVYKQNPEAFWQYHDWIFESQSDIKPENLKSKVLEFAKGKRIDAIQLSRCLDTRETEADLDKAIAEATALQVNQTPSLFVNGRLLTGRMGWPQLQGLIDFEIEYQKTKAAGGCATKDTGCEVKIPTPFSN
jgi:protein-disulfide isomerase